MLFSAYTQICSPQSMMYSNIITQDEPQNWEGFTAPPLVYTLAWLLLHCFYHTRVIISWATLSYKSLACETTSVTASSDLTGTSEVTRSPMISLCGHGVTNNFDVQSQSHPLGHNVVSALSIAPYVGVSTP